MSALDLVLVYLLPVATFIALWALVSLAIWVIARSSLDFAFKDDLKRKFGEKKKLRSGRGLRFSYWYVAKLLLADNCIQAALLYRWSSFCVRHRLGPLGDALHAFSKFATHIDVSPRCEIGPGVYLYHGLGLVIGKGTRIGARALICQGVTTGGGPVVGDDVKIWAGAKILGKVTVGDRSEVGANAVVLRDVPAGSVVAGVPAKVVSGAEAASERRPELSPQA